MTKRIHAKHKIDRRLGENVWGRPKSPFNKREYGPGEHGQRRRDIAVQAQVAIEAATAGLHHFEGNAGLREGIGAG